MTGHIPRCGCGEIAQTYATGEPVTMPSTCADCYRSGAVFTTKL